MPAPSRHRWKRHCQLNRTLLYSLPAEIISHGVWLYFRCCFSDREVEERLFARGILVTYEAIRKWCVTFGQQ